MKNISKIQLPDGSIYAIVDKGARELIEQLPSPVVFKGTLGSEGTIKQLPVSEKSNVGHMYKVIEAGEYIEGQYAKVGDLYICREVTLDEAYEWVLVPSGDEPSGTVTNIATGNGLLGGPITTTGTISVDTDVIATKEYVDDNVIQTIKLELDQIRSTDPLAVELTPEQVAIVEGKNGAFIRLDCTAIPGNGIVSLTQNTDANFPDLITYTSITSYAEDGKHREAFAFSYDKNTKLLTLINRDGLVTYQILENIDFVAEAAIEDEGLSLILDNNRGDNTEYRPFEQDAAFLDMAYEVGFINDPITDSSYKLYISDNEKIYVR